MSTDEVPIEINTDNSPRIEEKVKQHLTLPKNFSKMELLNDNDNDEKEIQ